jgi:hypothetical protein
MHKVQNQLMKFQKNGSAGDLACMQARICEIERDHSTRSLGLRSNTENRKSQMGLGNIKGV